MSVQIARGIGPAGIDIAFERFGDPGAPPLLLIMGLGTQMLGWPDGFCEALADRGMHVIRFDNRDIGLSTHFDGCAGARRRRGPDGGPLIGVIQAVGYGRRHGGPARRARAPKRPRRRRIDGRHDRPDRGDRTSAARVRSLTSIMSTTGDPSVGQPTRTAMAALLSPPAASREQAIERTLAIVRVIGSPGFELDEAEIRRRTGLAYDRSNDPVGVARQLVAIAASGDRTAALRGVSVPTLVVHGADDPLVDVSGGQATARAIAGADLAVFDGMGHDLPRGLWAELAGRIGELVRRADAARH